MAGFEEIEGMDWEVRVCIQAHLEICPAAGHTNLLHKHGKRLYYHSFLTYKNQVVHLSKFLTPQVLMYHSSLSSGILQPPQWAGPLPGQLLLEKLTTLA